jgi:hypothetical protein
MKSIERDVNPSIGVPGIEKFGIGECAAVGAIGSAATVGECLGGVVEGDQRSSRIGKFRVDEVADGSAIVDWHFLVRGSERSDPSDTAGIRGETTGQDLDQRSFALTVFADDSDA